MVNREFALNHQITLRNNCTFALNFLQENEERREMQLSQVAGQKRSKCYAKQKKPAHSVPV
jgi:hypothetical protein